MDLYKVSKRTLLRRRVFVCCVGILGALYRLKNDDAADFDFALCRYRCFWWRCPVNTVQTNSRHDGCSRGLWLVVILFALQALPISFQI